MPEQVSEQKAKRRAENDSGAALCCLLEKSGIEREGTSEMKINRDRGRNENHGVLITSENDSAWRTTHRDRPERTMVQVSPAPSIVVPAPPEGADDAPASFVVVVHRAPSAADWAEHARKCQQVQDAAMAAEKALQAAQDAYDADGTVCLALLREVRARTDAASVAADKARHPLPAPVGTTDAVSMVGVGFGCVAVPAVAAPAAELVVDEQLAEIREEQELAAELAEEFWRAEHARRAAVREAMLAEERAQRPARNENIWAASWQMVTTRSPRVIVVR